MTIDVNHSCASAIPGVTACDSRRVSFRFALDRQKLRTVRQREDRYLLRSNLAASGPAQLWQFYLQLVEVEAAFKSLKTELAT